MGFTCCVTLKDIFKPPILVFFVAITALAITLFAFSLSLEIKKDKILNPDVQNWNDFYKSLSSLNICLQSNSNKKIREQPNSEAKINTTTVSFNMDVSLIIDGIPSTNYFVHGFIRGDHLGHANSNDELHIIASLSKQKSMKHILPCVSFEGPRYLLPNAKFPSSKCSQPKKNPLQELTFVHPIDVRNKTLCPSSHVGSIIFAEKEDLNVYLSEMDTGLVQLHVVVMSAILFGMVLCFIMYSLMGRICRNEKKLSNDLESELILADSL